jgi:hypothetical protein
MASHVLNQLEVPRFHKLPVIEKPQGDIFPVDSSRKDFEKVKGLLSLGMVHRLQCTDSIVPALATEYETSKQNTSMLLCRELIRTSEERRKQRHYDRAVAIL